MCLSEYNVHAEHDGVDKIRVDSTWQHVHMQMFCACATCRCFAHVHMLLCLMIEHTKNPKEQIEHLICARKVV